MGQPAHAGRLQMRGPLGIAALFSGVALLLNILGGIDLRLGFIATTVTMVASAALVLGRASTAERAALRQSVLIGTASGIVSTVAYDLAKYALGMLDPSPFDPFHAIVVFGEYLAGPTAGTGPILAAGWAFHVLNGTAFGVAYTLLLGMTAATPRRTALITGLGWGLFLEAFQITLYPGWLDIRAYQEFVVISASAHLVYGATLGTLARGLFRWNDKEGSR
jgi:hypothetical protein